MKRSALIPVESIQQRILLIRGHKVMMDATLAELYGVPTKVLLQAIRRNRRRFPADFMFTLTADEWTGLRSQNVTSKPGRGGRRYAPLVFTEQGVAMLSSVLNSDRAIDVNIAIMRAFVQLRQMLTTHRELAAKLACRCPLLRARYLSQVLRPPAQTRANKWSASWRVMMRPSPTSSKPCANSSPRVVRNMVARLGSVQATADVRN